MTDNRYDRIVDLVSEKAKELSDAMAEQMRGGKYPPGTLPLSRSEQLWEYGLLSRPLASLPDDLRQEALERRKRFAGKPELDVRAWVYDMERLQAKEIRRGQEVSDAIQE